jgi:hypothetical protein
LGRRDSDRGLSGFTYEAIRVSWVLAGIKRGLESMKRHRGKPAEKFFQEFFAEKGIPEHE